MATKSVRPLTFFLHKNAHRKILKGRLGAIGGQGTGLADLASLAGGFSQLKLDSGMITKFVPVILNFVKGKAGADVTGLPAKVMQK